MFEMFCVNIKNLNLSTSEQKKHPWNQKLEFKSMVFEVEYLVQLYLNVDTEELFLSKYLISC